MLVNPGVAGFKNYAHETVAQILESLRAFQRALGISISTIEAMLRQRADFLLLQGKPLWRGFLQRTGEALSRQSHLKLLATRARDGVYAILLQREPLLHRILYLYGTTKNRKTLLTLIVPAAFAGLALIILFLKMGMSDQAGSEHAGSRNVTTSGRTQAPDWTIFDDAFAKQPTRLATSEFLGRVKTSGAALTTDPAETTGQVIMESVPLPRPRPKHR